MYNEINKASIWTKIAVKLQASVASEAAYYFSLIKGSV